MWSDWACSEPAGGLKPCLVWIIGQGMAVSKGRGGGQQGQEHRVGVRARSRARAWVVGGGFRPGGIPSLDG